MQIKYLYFCVLSMTNHFAMKKYLFALALSLMTICASAQGHFGFQGGVNFNGTWNNKGVYPEGKNGFHLGMFVDVELKNNFYLKPSLLYTQRGVDVSHAHLGYIFSSQVIYSSEDVKFHYLQVPVEVNYRFPIGPISVDAIAGGFLSYGLNAKGKDANYFEPQDGEDAMFKRFDAGFRYGFGIHLFKHIGISAYCDKSLVKVFNDKEHNEYFNHSSYQIAVSYAF